MPELDSEDYKKKHLMEQERLAKLWDAYQIQEKALKEATDAIRKLETDRELKTKEVQSLNEMVEKRDKQLREMEREVTNLQKITADYKPKLESCEAALGKEKDKLAKLYDVAQEMEEELGLKTKAVEQRDTWFLEHFSFFEGVGDVLAKWKEVAEARLMKEEMVKKLSGGREPTDLKKAGVLAELASLESVDDDTAALLYDAGFTSLEALRKARSFELVAIQGISPTKATKIFQEMKKF